MNLTYHLSLITYHLSLITYHLSLITYHFPTTPLLSRATPLQSTVQAVFCTLDMRRFILAKTRRPWQGARSKQFRPSKNRIASRADPEIHSSAQIVWTVSFTNSKRLTW